MDVHEIISMVAAEYVSIKPHRVSHIDVARTDDVWRTMVADYTMLSPPKISTVARYITRRERDIRFVLFGFLLMLFGVLLILAEKIGVGFFFLIIGGILVVLYIYFPSFKPYVIVASENVYVCHHCGKLLTYDEAIMLPTQEAPRFLLGTFRERNILVRFLLGFAILILLIAKLFAIIVDIALKKRGTEESISAKIDEVIARLSTTQLKTPKGCEIITLGIRGPYGYTLEVKILKCGYHYTVHCIDCLRKHHPHLYEALTEEGEEKAIVVSSEIRRRFLVSPRKFAFKSEIEYLKHMMKLV